MKEKNFLEDFRLALRLYACTMDGEKKEEIGFPDYDFRAVFYTDGNKTNAYTASCIGGKCTNCFNDNGRVCVVFNNHRLGLGVLNVEFTAYIPDGYYPDGDQRSVVPAPLDVKLVRHATPCPKDIEVDLMLPYIQFRYKDLTDAEKAELMRPATEAAQRADEAVAKAETATAEAVKSNQELAENVAEAEKSEQQRQQAEEDRKAAEALRSEAESGRVEAEAARVLAESGRKDAECLREEAEKARREAEGSRAGAEAVRGDSEARRVEAEAARAKAESERQTAENTRNDAETQRGTNEDARKAAETSRAGAETARQTAESGRKTAEDARAKAESDRRTEFAGWKDTIDGKADREELSNVLAEETQTKIEAIEPMIVTNALRKNEQALTTAEQAQVLKNLGNPEYKTFIDQWNMAWGAFGKYDPVNAPDALHPFYGNTLWMTYEEAIAVMANYGFVSVKNLRVPNTNVRTNVPEKFTGATGSMLLELDCKFFNTPAEVLGFQYGAIIKNAALAFDTCNKLRTIIGNLTIRGPLSISKSPLLEDVSITVESYNNSPNPIVLSGCPLINLASLQYIVTHAMNTKAITITLHPEAYARLTPALIADAAAKNITFATA